MGHEWDICIYYQEWDTNGKQYWDMNGISILIYIKPTIICQLSQLDMMMDLSEHRVPQNPLCIIIFSTISNPIWVYILCLGTGHSHTKLSECWGFVQEIAAFFSWNSTTQSIGLGETAAGNPWIFPWNMRGFGLDFSIQWTAERPTRWNSSLFFSACHDASEATSTRHSVSLGNKPCEQRKGI
jgi:hypothetical protein